jgi:7,8-dihydroneopterin aldolase/epimerase/oxygenase
MPDRIEIRGLRAVGLIGVNPEERERPQPFEVDFDVEVDTSRAGTTDELIHTVDYGRLTLLASAVVTDEQHNLLERVAERISQELLAADDRIDATSVTVRKLRPPIPVDVSTSGVSISRRRP